jgi:heme A synthase
MADIRVVTPDGHVWFVRRRWARRRMPWQRALDERRAWRRTRRAVRRARRPVDPFDPFRPGPFAAIIWLGRCGDEGSLWWLALVLAMALLALLVFLGWLLVTAALPWSLSHSEVLLTGLAVGAGAALVIAALVLTHRPWLVEAERMGLDPPRRVWRVTGWRCSRRCIREVAAALAQGRPQVEPTGAVPLNFRQPLVRGRPEP